MSVSEALPDLVACFHVKRGLFRRERVEAAVFELDNFGCVMKTDRVFNPGDTLILELVMEMPFDNIHANGITGLVTERRKHCSNFFYSIDFARVNNEASPDTLARLKRIRDVVSKKQSLKSRRSSGPPGIRQLA